MLPSSVPARHIELFISDEEGAYAKGDSLVKKLVSSFNAQAPFAWVVSGSRGQRDRMQSGAHNHASEYAGYKRTWRLTSVTFEDQLYLWIVPMTKPAVLPKAPDKAEGKPISPIEGFLIAALRGGAKPEDVWDMASDEERRAIFMRCAQYIATS